MGSYFKLYGLRWSGKGVLIFNKAKEGAERSVFSQKVQTKDQKRSHLKKTKFLKDVIG